MTDRDIYRMLADPTEYLPNGVGGWVTAENAATVEMGDYDPLRSSWQDAWDSAGILGFTLVFNADGSVAGWTQDIRPAPLPERDQFIDMYDKFQQHMRQYDGMCSGFYEDDDTAI
ncbi:MAG: hypothetical protein M5U09_12605 [Gammaproteobacteria bacterium]|nr:hypothetical protein [Gammaproteobacteria bacterium]